MEKIEEHYLETIRKRYNDLRNALLTAICHYLEECYRLTEEIRCGNEKLTSIRTVFNERGYAVMEETTLSFDIYQPEGLVTESVTVPLNKAGLEWLIAIYKSLSRNRDIETVRPVK